MLYAVKNDMALLDLDEWQAIREATGLSLEWEDARTINNILYEGYDFTPLDIQANEKTTSIKEAILSDLSAEDESKIYEVLSKYENNRLMPENGQEFNHRLADSLEQVMFERGEYDFAESDRIRWLDNVPEPYALADDPATLQEARSIVTQNIENALNGEIQDISAIKDYLKDQLAEMVEEDELIPTVEGYVKILEGMETIKEVDASVELGIDPVHYLMEETRNCIDAVRGEYQRQKDSELAYDMIESVNCEVKQNAAGTYDVIDGLTGEYRATDCEDLSQVISSLENLVENNLLDYMANELYRSSDFSKLGEGSVPQTAEEWNAVANNPDFAGFTTEHQTEMQEIELLANIERLQNANIEYVAFAFNPEDKEYTAYQLNKLYNAEDKTISMYGEAYTATADAEKVFAEPSYSSLYKIELNEADMTFDVRDTDDLRAVKEQELSATLADFINSKDMELDVIEANGFNRYALYDKDTGDYRKGEDGKAEYLHNAEDLLTNMNVYVEEVQNDLEEAFLDTYGDSREIPSTVSEWVSFAGRRGNEDFVKDYKAELNLMRVAHEPNAASISKVYEIQNERQEQAKEQPAKNHKKFDKTDD